MHMAFNNTQNDVYMQSDLHTIKRSQDALTSRQCTMRPFKGLAYQLDSFKDRLSLSPTKAQGGVYFLFIYVNKARINIPNKSIREIAWNVDMSITPFLSGMSQTPLSKPFNCTSYIIHEKIGKHIQNWMCFFVFKKQTKGSF